MSASPWKIDALEFDVYVNVNYIQEPMGNEATAEYGISDLAREFAVTPRTIRFYEDEGLLNPERRGQNRVFCESDRTKLAWILRAKRVGFSIADVKEMLELYDLDDNRVTQRRVTLGKCRERIAALEEQRRDLDDAITELQEFCHMLEGELNGAPREVASHLRVRSK